METPRTRGGLNALKYFINGSLFPDAPYDDGIHFPSGERGLVPGSTPVPGAGYRYQQENLDSRGYIPFEPMDPSYHWRYGVCGDRLDNNDHLKGGRYYYDGKIVKTYFQGSVIGIKLAIIFNHGGYVILHVCDVSKCGGEISEQCFKTPNACHKLQRVDDEMCERENKFCTPIDKAYPERWYFPCEVDTIQAIQDNKTYEFFNYGPEHLKFKLPFDFTCEHCVMHWHWTGADRCSPVGVVDYFQSPNGPMGWDSCQFLGKISTGYSLENPDCNGTMIPEEYSTCADISIKSFITGPIPVPISA